MRAGNLKGIRNTQNGSGVYHSLNVDVPNHWMVVPLEEVLDDIIGGGTPSKANPEYWVGSIPWLTVKDMRTRRPEDAIDHISMEAVRDSATNIISAGTVIIATRIGLGKVIRVPYDAAINQDLKALVAKPGLEKGYLEYWILSIADYLESIGSGTTVKGIRLEQLRSLPFPLAPLKEQKLIVTEIEKQFSRLDEAAANLKHVKANLKRYKASVLKAAVEGKLTEDWRKKHPNVEPASKLLERVLAERRAKFGRKKDSFLTAEGAPPAEAPDGWTICSIDQIAECLDAKRVPVNKAERAKRGGNVPYYGANGQVGVIDDYIFDEPLVLVVEDETFTGRTQAFSYLIRGKSWVNNHAHVLRATDAVTASYLNYGLAHYPFIPRTTGSTGRRKLTQRGLMTAPFLLPPLIEQEQIVAEVERRLSVIDELEATVKANLTGSDRLRQSVLSQAFSGRLLGQDTKHIPGILPAYSIAAESQARYEKTSRAGR